MQTPVRIEFQGMDSSDVLRDEIAGHASRLEDRFGRVTSCRVVLKGPGEHHREGGLYEVNIRLSLPNGKEVNVDRTPGVDERHADVHFAISDAFKRARRRLQDHARRLQGHVKVHAPEPVGTVTRLDKGFGFLQASDGREIYFHGNSVLNGGFARLRVGTRVAFAEEAGEKGPQASTVKLLGKHGMRP
jgi:cold shock CspA family protein/ribosome-associated translation inhibitor RaiA